MIASPAAVFAVLCAAAAAAVLWAVGFLPARAGGGPVPDSEDSAAPPRWLRWTRRRQVSRRQQPRRRWWMRGGVLFGAAAGLVIGAVTGWWVAVSVVPVLLLAVPVLLSSSPQQVLTERLEGMQEWVRNLVGVLSVGRGLEQAIQATAERGVPRAIRPEVTALAARLRAGQDMTAALAVFADELDDATGDLIVAALTRAAVLRGDGLAAVLDGLARTVTDDVRIRRAIQAERAKHYTTIRGLTLFMLLAIGYGVLNPTWSVQYQTPLGQLLLAGYILAYVAVLVWIRRLAAAKPLPRFIPPDKITLRAAANRRRGHQPRHSPARARGVVS